MGDFGIKVVKAGTTVLSTNIRDFILHSSYSMFKIHGSLTGTTSINAGGTAGTTTISHSLGYVPAFLVYEKNGNNYDLFPQNLICYAGSNSITIITTLNTPYNQVTYGATDYWNTSVNGSTSVEVGNDNFVPGPVSGAMRFTNISLNQGEAVVSANIDFHVDHIGTGGDVKFICRGINEDNTANFSSSPMARAQTTASGTQTQSQSSVPFTFGVNTKSQIEEIVARSGWSSGNAAGFFFFDNSSPTNAHVYDYYDPVYDSINGTLRVTRSGTLNTVYQTVIFKDKVF